MSSLDMHGSLSAQHSMLGAGDLSTSNPQRTLTLINASRANSPPAVHPCGSGSPLATYGSPASPGVGEPPAKRRLVITRTDPEKLPGSEVTPGMNWSSNLAPPMLSLPQATLPVQSRPGQATWLNASQVWAMTLPRSLPSVRASAPGAAEPWASFAVAALRRSAPRALLEAGDDSISSSSSAASSVPVQMSAEAVDILRQWLIEWLGSFLKELHELSMRRVGMRAGADIASGNATMTETFTTSSAEPPDGCVRRPVVSDNEDPREAEAALVEKLLRDQRIRRIEPADMQMFLRDPRMSSLCNSGLTGRASLRRTLQMALEEEMLRFH